jgi:hypothetical protein
MMDLSPTSSATLVNSRTMDVRSVTSTCHMPLSSTPSVNGGNAGFCGTSGSLGGVRGMKPNSRPTAAEVAVLMERLALLSVSLHGMADRATALERRQQLPPTLQPLIQGVPGGAGLAHAPMSRRTRRPSAAL